MGARAASGVDKKKVFNELEAQGRTDRAISEDLGPRMAEAEELYSKLGGKGGKADADTWYTHFSSIFRASTSADFRDHKLSPQHLLVLVIWHDRQPAGALQ